MAIRYTSLAAGVATAVFLVVGLWQSARAMPDQELRSRLGLAVISAAAATLPVFYFALCRSRTALVFPKGLRLTAAISAAALTVEFVFLFSRVTLYRAPNSGAHSVTYLYFLVL